MATQRVHDLRLMDRAEPGNGRLRLTACSVCLRVQRGSEWIAPDEVIRRMRTFELDTPRLAPALCERCSEELRLRRGPAEEPLAA